MDPFLPIYQLHPEWQPVDIAYIESVLLSLDEQERPLLNMEIAFLSQRYQGMPGWPDEQYGFTEIRMAFNGVQHFRLAHAGNSRLQVSGFRIMQHYSNQQEEMNFKVEDEGNGLLDFYCKSIRVLSVTPQVSKI